ncbi:MAG: sulfotransferase, partial [Candidatus Neomarinimicrobiota bacterium]
MMQSGENTAGSNNRDGYSRLCFIFGAPRSGTTWIWGLLTSHPAVNSLNREDFGGEPSTVGGKRLTSETGVFCNNKLDDAKIKAIIDKKLNNQPDKVFIERTPTHTLLSERILALFPDARIIFLQRDPRAVVNSMLRSDFYSFARDVVDATLQTKAYLRAYEAVKDRPNVLTVKYEDLLEYTEVTLRRVLDFLNLDSGPITSMIDENDKRVKVDIAGVYRVGKADAYNEELSPEDRRLIESELFDYMQLLGYDTRMSGGKEATVRAVGAERLRILIGLTKLNDFTGSETYT